jgi:hypothetical protein
MPAATTRTPQTVAQTTPTRTTRPRRVRGGRHDRAEPALGGRGPRPDHVRVSVRVGNGLLGFQQVDIIEAWVPLFLFAVLFGLSMGYQVFLLSRIRERHSATGDNAGSVSLRLRQRVHPAYIPQEAPGDPRPHPRIPQRRGRKALLSPGIPAYPRAARKRHDRPVTPEVAGSSPVAPVSRNACKWALMVVWLDAE